MGKEEKLAILKSCVGMLFSLEQEMKQKLGQKILMSRRFLEGASFCTIPCLSGN